MSTKKKVQVADETIVTAPLFVKHHYLILESADGTSFYVDRNAALTSRLIAVTLKELGNRADEELDDPTEAPQAQEVFTILGGDVEVKCNGEKAANASAQLPIVYPSTFMAAMAQQQQQLQQAQLPQGLRPNTADSNSVSLGRGGAAPASTTKGTSKANQQQIATQESLAQALLQYHQVDAALSAMAGLPITHLRLVHINAPVLELAIRFMHYKYKNDSIPDAEARQGFFAFISNRSYQPPQGSSTSPFGGFSASAGSPGSASPSKRKASMAAALMGAAPVPPAVDPITGGGIAHMPAVFTQKHLELLAASALLQL